MKIVKNIFALTLALHIPFYAQQAPLMSSSALPIPSQEEMQEAFQQLMNMSEEERKQLEAEALNQLASLSESDLKQIEADMMNRIASLTPEEREELEREGRKMLIAWGIDPDTGKPLEPEKTEKPIEPSKEAPIPSTPTKQVPPTTTAYAHGDLDCLLEQLIQNLKEVRHTASMEQFKQLPLETFSQELDQFIQLLTITNQSHHHQRLLEKEYESMIRVMDRLNKTLQSNQLLISTKEALLTEPQETDPYEILGIPYTATNKEIEKVYTTLAEKNDPIKVRQRLERQGATERELEKAEKEARISFNLIVDAYESLSNELTRSQIDRERKARQQQQKFSAQEARAILLSNIDTISNALHQHQLLAKLNDFLQKYEPEKLAQLNAMRAAEEKRKEEHKKATETRPIKTPSLPSIPGRQPPYQRDYEYERYPGKPYIPSGDRPMPEKPSPKPEEDKKPGKKDEKKEEKKNEKKDEKKEEKKEEPDKKADESKKPAEKPSEPSAEDVQKIGALFSGVYQAAQDLTQMKLQLQQTMESITSAKDLLQESSTLQRQQQLLNNYAAQLSRLQQAFAMTKDPAARTVYKDTWNAIKQEDSVKKTEQLANTINRALQHQEPEDTGAIITAEQSQRLRSWISTINSVRDATQKINVLVNE